MAITSTTSVEPPRTTSRANASTGLVITVSHGSGATAGVLNATAGTGGIFVIQTAGNTNTSTLTLTANGANQAIEFMSDTE